MFKMAQISFGDLQQIRKEHKDKKIVFCSGSFDLTHAGHVLFFEDCKKYGDILVVGVGSDKMLKENKGDKRPILNEHIRLKMIDSLKPVDYCILDNISDKEHPLGILNLAFESLKPDIYVINEDAFNITYRIDLCKKFNIEMVKLKRWCPKEFDSISATKIINTILILKDANNLPKSAFSR